MILNHEETRSEKNNQNSYLSKAQVKFCLIQFISFYFTK